MSVHKVGYFCLLFTCGLCCSFVSAQEAGDIPFPYVPGKHQGAVTFIAHNGNEIISAGEDGFIEVWNISQNTAASRLQTGTWRIDALALRAGTGELCVAESEEPGLYRISAWNYTEGKKLFSVMCNDQVRYLDYSGGGSFIIAAARGGEGLLLLDSKTGEIWKRFETLGGMVIFAATGRVERNILVYLASREILYLDLVLETETARFPAPAGLEKLVIFANNRCLAGLGTGGLVIIDAATGTVLDRSNDINGSALLCPGSDGFYCMDYRTAELRRYALNRQGRLEIKERLVLQGRDTLAGQKAISAMAAGFAFGTNSGSVLVLQNGKLVEMAHNKQNRISALAASDKRIAFLNETGGLVFLPLDYRLIFEGMSLVYTERETAYNEISALVNNEKAGNGSPLFLLWKNGGTEAPAIVSEGVQADVLNELAPRYPLRSVSAAAQNLLLLDSRGNAEVYNLADREKTAAGYYRRIFGLNTTGALDAAFADSSNIILSRPVVSSNAPFLKVNITTGETLPLPYPAQAGYLQAGLHISTSASGIVYGVAAIIDGRKTKTSVLRLNAPAKWEEIANYPGEDARVSIAESSGITAISLGSEGAALYTGQEICYFERSPGLPLKIVGSDLWFIVLDSEGNICWHDKRSGKLLAVFRLYPNGIWTLKKGETTLQGTVTY